MAVYSCTLFFNEFHLLDLKIAEERDVVDKIYVVEANQTFQCNPKELLLEGNEKYDDPKVELCFLRNKLAPKLPKKGHTYPNRNQTIHRNSIADFVPYKDKDVLIVTDLDEIIPTEDFPMIVDAARKHGCVRLCQRMYYYKINLARTTKNGWLGPFALTGKYLRELIENKKGLQHVRGYKQRLGKPIMTNGKHFSFLMNPEMIAYKIKNFSHHNFNSNKFTNTDKIIKRIENMVDPFERKTKDGDLRMLFKTSIDDTYPKTILNNLDDWKEYIA